MDRSVDLEHGEYETNIELVIDHGLQAIAETEAGYFVNLVTPSTFGNPEDYLGPLIKEIYQDQVRIKFIDQCGCGGYVLRVWKGACHHPNIVEQGK